MNKVEELIEQLCPDGVEFTDIETLIKNKSVSTVSPPYKLTKNLYQAVGVFPIVDQGQNFIVGYTDNEKVIIDKGLYVIFGDHTEALKYVDFAFAQGADGIKIIKTNQEFVIAKYFYYALINFYIKTGKYTRHFSFVKKTSIPVPPLPIQQEIVTILDKFTQLEAELEAELEVRRKQYKYCLNQLLIVNDKGLKANGVQAEWKTLGVICLSISAGGDLPENYIKGQKTPSNKYPYPIFTNATGINGLYGYTDNYKIESDAVTISARGTIGYHTIREGKFTPIVRLITIIPNREIITTKFLNYILDITSIVGTEGGIPQLTVPTVKKIKIPIPSLSEQERIVAILDKFDKLANSKSEGLPAEIQERRKQYEYYRGKLFDFKNLNNG